MKITTIDLKTTDPEFNLAAEEYVFNSLPKDRMYFMLWQNANAVIVGKYQNTRSEINESYVRENHVKVVRRLSGGGAVYHDMGNLNYTVITDAGASEELNFEIFCAPVVKVLKSMGVNACVNGRNDITVDGRKISGNSQYIKNGRVMHHGTILLNSDLGKVEKVLTPDLEKLQSNGKKSVHSRVANISEFTGEEINIEKFKKLLFQEISATYEKEMYTFSKEDNEKIEKIKEERYSSWEWNCGKSRECSYTKSERIPGVGKVEARIALDHGSIQSIQFTGDFFSAKDPEELEKLLTGCKAEESEYRKILNEVNCGDYFRGLDEESLIQLLI